MIKRISYISPLVLQFFLFRHPFYFGFFCSIEKIKSQRGWDGGASSKNKVTLRLLTPKPKSFLLTKRMSMIVRKDETFGLSSLIRQSNRNIFTVRTEMSRERFIKFKTENKTDMPRLNPMNFGIKVQVLKLSRTENCKVLKKLNLPLALSGGLTSLKKYFFLFIS